MKNNYSNFIAFLLVFLIFNVNAVEWTKQDLVSEQHYIDSFKYHEKYVSILNQTASDVVAKNKKPMYFGVMNPKDVLKNEQLALDHAMLVEDSFLDKVHTDLKKHYREEYQEGVRLDVSSWKDVNMLASLVAISLDSEWSKWHKKNRKKFKFPSDADDSLSWWVLVLLILIGAVVLPIIGYLYYKWRMGLIISRHMILFGEKYDQVYRDKGRHDHALRIALEVFKTCPKLKELNEDDYDLIVRIIGDTNYPMHVMSKLITTIDSSHIVDDLRNEELLKEVADIYRKKD
jgi:hypothetical protein